MLMSPRFSRQISSRLLMGGSLALLMALALYGPTSAAGNNSVPRPMVSRGGLSVPVPGRGIGVVASALMVNGRVRELQVETGADGQVVITEPTASSSVANPWGSARGGRFSLRATSAMARPASLPACSDPARSVSNSWWHHTLHWTFKASSAPANLGVSTAETQLRRSMRNITDERNDCGRPDRVSATAIYDGRTSRSPQIGGNDSCTGTDGQNTVAFGDLGPSTVGFTCWWYIGNQTVEADMQLNKLDFSFAVSPSRCANQFILQGVATHEFGHVFGLRHVSQSSHANLTMSTQVYPCDASDATLGLGDMLALETHY